MRKQKFNWSQLITWVLTSTAIIISLCSGAYQWNQSRRYSNNTNQILINSAKLAMYDLDVMIDKIDTGGDDNLDYGQFRFQLDSLKQNFKTIESIDPTSLPKNEAINYQVYRQNLNAIIYKSTSYVNSLRVNKSGVPQDNDKLHIDLGIRNNFYKGIGSSHDVVSKDLSTLTKRRNLFDTDYKKSFDELEQEK